MADSFPMFDLNKPVSEDDDGHVEFDLQHIFLGIPRVLSMESKQDFCNTSNCFEGSHED